MTGYTKTRSTFATSSSAPGTSSGTRAISCQGSAASRTCSPPSPPLASPTSPAATIWPTMDTLKNLPSAVPGLFDPSFSVKVVEVAKKYNAPEVSLCEILVEERELTDDRVSRSSGFRNIQSRAVRTTITAPRVRRVCHLRYPLPNPLLQVRLSGIPGKLSLISSRLLMDSRFLPRPDMARRRTHLPPPLVRRRDLPEGRAHQARSAVAGVVPVLGETESES